MIDGDGLASAWLPPSDADWPALAAELGVRA
jgi:hypothetical protein